MISLTPPPHDADSEKYMAFAMECKNLLDALGTSRLQIGNVYIALFVSDEYWSFHYQDCENRKVKQYVLRAIKINFDIYSGAQIYSYRPSYGYNIYPDSDKTVRNSNYRDA